MSGCKGKQLSKHGRVHQHNIFTAVVAAGTDAWSIHKGSCMYGYLDWQRATGWDVAAMSGKLFVITNQQMCFVITNQQFCSTCCLSMHAVGRPCKLPQLLRLATEHCSTAASKCLGSHQLSQLLYSQHAESTCSIYVQHTAPRLISFMHD